VSRETAIKWLIFYHENAAVGCNTFMDPKELSINDFTYDLPEEKIAKYPLSERDSSKLLVYKQNIEQNIYQNIDQYLPENSLLICNNTKVIEARLLFQKPTGAFIEVFCLEPHHKYRDIATAMSQQETVVWLCLIGGASKWKHGQILEKKITLPDKEIILNAQFLEKLNDSFAVRFSWTPIELNFVEILHSAGTIPLPPYLKRESEASDKIRYQTMYADAEGSVAAPTAGLHFTDKIFEKLKAKQILIDSLTLHVGAGTFKPVKGNKLGEHDMHAEFIDVGISTIKNIIHYSNRFITAVGTTSLRTIESLYWIGLKLIHSKNFRLPDLSVKQWEPYESVSNKISALQSLNAVVHWMEKNNLTRLVTKTQIMIAPGYEIKIAKALVTNFHQPNSTLLLLVAAFVGEDWKKIYQLALENEFRFLSYGDGCLLFRNQSFS
jgi:S-adenosylmethionine:tRNA ribosyltransferase-isomerase